MLSCRCREFEGRGWWEEAWNRGMFIKRVCSAAGRCLQPAPASLRGKNPTSVRQLGKLGRCGGQMSSEGKGIPGRTASSPPEPPTLLTQNILSWNHEHHPVCGLELCSVLPLAQMRNFQALNPCFMGLFFNPDNSVVCSHRERLGTKKPGGQRS